MGVWGARIYESDSALDIRGDFRDKLDAGEPVKQIEQAILTEYIEGSEPEDQGVYMALACAELETGTLSDGIKQKALEEIKRGPDEKLWEDLVGLRKREFTLIKKYLDSYSGQPIKRKSWTELQKVDNDVDKQKLDDITWQVLDDKYKDLAEDKYLAIAGAHLDCFVYWLIARDYLVLDSTAMKKDALKVKTSQLSTIEFLDKHMDLKLFSSHITPAVKQFVMVYYNFDADGENPSYVADYYELVKRDREELSFVPTKIERQTVAKKLDERLKEYQLHPYSSVASSKKHDLKTRMWSALFLLWLFYILFRAANYLFFS
jgi:hypothetical protein